MALLRESCQMICVSNLETSDWKLCPRDISCHWMFNPPCWTKSRKPKRRTRKLKRLKKRLAKEKPKDSMKTNKELYGMENVSAFRKIRSFGNLFYKKHTTHHIPLILVTPK